MRGDRCLPGIMVFHLATRVSEKNSVVFLGTNSSSAFHFMTLVATVAFSVRLLSRPQQRQLTVLIRPGKVASHLPRFWHTCISQQQHSQEDHNDH